MYICMHVWFAKRSAVQRRFRHCQSVSHTSRTNNTPRYKVWLQESSEDMWRTIFFHFSFPRDFAHFRHGFLSCSEFDILQLLATNQRKKPTALVSMVVYRRIKRWDDSHSIAKLETKSVSFMSHTHQSHKGQHTFLFFYFLCTIQFG